MHPTTLKIKTKILHSGDSIAGLAADWGFSRELLTKVIHCERGNREVQKRLARYVGVPVKQLFGEEAGRKAA